MIEFNTISFLDNAPMFNYFMSVATAYMLFIIPIAIITKMLYGHWG